jgi:hypothetical protein
MKNKISSLPAIAYHTIFQDVQVVIVDVGVLEVLIKMVTNTETALLNLTFFLLSRNDFIFNSNAYLPLPFAFEN